MHEEEEPVGSFTEITDPKYLALLEKVEKKPSNYPNWQIVDGMLYVYRTINFWTR